MAGDIEKAEYWPDADVYVADLGTTIPADESVDFAAGWDLVGLLDGEAGFVESREEDVEDHFAWGGILVRTTRRNFILSKSFTALEYNDVTRDLIYPGSSSGVIVVPRPMPKLVAFETRGTLIDGTPTVRRLITSNYAEISVDGDRSEVENDITRTPFMVKIFPDASVSPAELFIEQPALGS
jgi:hypothetical protein